MNINKNTGAGKIQPVSALTEKTLALLEYHKITESVASYAVSAEAADIIKDSKPYFNGSDTACEYVEQTKAKVRAIHALLLTSENEPRSWLPSIGFLHPKIETSGVVLDLDEVLAVGLFIERGTELINWISKERSILSGRAPQNTNISALNSLLKNIPDCSPAADEIFNVIDRDGNLRDLPVLRAIRKRIDSLEKELKAAVSRYSADDEYKRMLQSPLPSQRDGRAVIAVKSNYRGRIQGIVHEVSSSGQTVFVEPLDVVEKNNEILLEKRALDAEIQKILRELTENISAYTEELKAFHVTVIELECLRARAKYSAATKGHFAKTGAYTKTVLIDGSPMPESGGQQGESLLLKQARHPLLKKPVPIDIKMEENTRTLIITGPNTGGKTVALKTLGLLAMMNQSALALPAQEGSVLPVFDGIYADIGDEQSIDQSLSTFSAHITNISAITAHATDKSLVLLDELGSGTDPKEGSAIAMAILDYLIDKKSRMIITTHHGILKNYGYTRQGVENASVEFDAQTLSPTYKIINGLPGESRALDVAEANGLNKKIVEKARRYIDEEKSDISAMIKGLEQKQRELAGIEKISAMEQNRLKEEKRKADLKELQLRQKEAELKREHIGKLQLLLGESRKTLENLVREVKEGEITREKTLKVKDFLNTFAHNVDSESETLDEEERDIREQLRKLEGADASAGGTSNAVFSEGMEVFAGHSKQRGIIIRADKKAGKKETGGSSKKSSNKWLVKIGSLKVSFSEKDLIPAAPAAQEKPSAKKKASVSWSAEINASNEAVYELMVRKMSLEDALDAVRRQIDAAILTGLKNFAIIHGKGHGILRSGIHDYLRNNPAVAEFHFSRPEMGGFGRTEVVLR